MNPASRILNRSDFPFAATGGIAIATDRQIRRRDMAGAAFENQEDPPVPAEKKTAKGNEENHESTKEDVSQSRNGAGGGDPERKTGPGRKPRACEKPLGAT